MYWLLIFSLIGSSTMFAAANDLSLYQYTSNGEVAQIQYAYKHIAKLSPKISFKDKDSGAIVTLSVEKRRSKLLLSDKKSIATLPDTNIVIAAAGYSPDNTYLLNQMNTYTQNHFLKFGEPPSLDGLSSHIAMWMTRGLYGQYSDEGNEPISRPLASVVILAGYDDESEKPRLLEVENSGAVTEKTLILLGAASDATRETVLNTVLSSPTSAGTGSPDLPQQLRAGTTNTKSHNTWNICYNSALLHKCESCLKALLFENDWLDDSEKSDSEEDLLIECCIIKRDGTIVNSCDTNTMMYPGSEVESHSLTSVEDTISWIRKQM
jgi:20S proteasome alpha/beta subunit